MKYGVAIFGRGGCLVVGVQRQSKLGKMVVIG